MASELEVLQGDLDRLQQLFRLARSPEWNQVLAPIADGLRSSTGRTAALEELKGYFGGMGSLNDVVFCQENNNVPEGLTADEANRELEDLLDRIFREASLFGLPESVRIEWLQEVEGANLPPRIQNAFRRQP